MRHILKACFSATQQVPLGELRFDVSSSGDSSFVLSDQASSLWSPGAETDTNGHGRFVPNKKKNIIEEEDPYEKIEIKKSVEEVNKVEGGLDDNVSGQKTVETVTASSCSIKTSEVGDKSKKDVNEANTKVESSKKSVAEEGKSLVQGAAAVTFEAEDAAATETKTPVDNYSKIPKKNKRDKKQKKEISAKSEVEVNEEIDKKGESVPDASDTNTLDVIAKNKKNTELNQLTAPSTVKAKAEDLKKSNNDDGTEKEKLRLIAEEEERKKDLSDIKTKELSPLELEAEESRMKQRQEMLHMLDGDMTDLHNMKDQVLVVVDKQKKIKGVVQKRLELHPIREEEQAGNDSDIKTLMNRTSTLFSCLADDENKVLTLKGKIASMNPDELSDEVRDIKTEIINKSKQIQELSEETDIMYDKEQKLLDEACVMKETDQLEPSKRPEAKPRKKEGAASKSKSVSPTEATDNSASAPNSLTNTSAGKSVPLKPDTPEEQSQIHDVVETPLVKKEQELKSCDDSKEKLLNKNQKSPFPFRIRKGKNKEKESKKTQEYNNQDLDALRTEFAKKQGVEGVVVEPFKPLNTQSSLMEDVALKPETGNEEDKFEFKETGVQEAVKKPKKIAEESLYEPVGADREEFVKRKQTQKDENDTEIQEGGVIDDNVIGFDVREGKQEGNDGENDADHHNISSLVPPKLPERRKTSSKQSLNKVSICEKEKVERKEKKSSFIKEWQKDLKEFFSLRKKKSSTSSQIPEDTPRRERREISVDNESLFLEDHSVNGFSNNSDPAVEKSFETTNSTENGINTSHENHHLKETVVAEKSSADHIERRKKKRKDRRKTNSECHESNPSKSENGNENGDILNQDDVVENFADKTPSQKPKVVVPSPLGKYLLPSLCLSNSRNLLSADSQAMNVYLFSFLA